MVGAAVSLALFSSAALAAPNVVNTTQKGSFLVFPEIDVSGGVAGALNNENGGHKNTFIRITNDNTRDIDVKCYYGEFTGDVYKKPTRDFQFTLTKNQPAYWEVEDGTGTITVPDFPTFKTGTGQLVCWAVSRGGGKQVKWNHLSGTATVVDYRYGTSYSYNAYQFFARGVKNKAQVGDTAGVLELNGTRDGGAYDKCGRYIIGHFSPVGAINGNMKPAANAKPGIAVAANYLSLSSCTQGLSPVGKANPVPLGCTDGNCGQTIVFDVWNEDEVKFTGAREKADSWWRIVLGEEMIWGTDKLVPSLANGHYSPIDVAPENFTYDQLQTASAYFRAESDDRIGLLGVLMTKYLHGLYDAQPVPCSSTEPCSVMMTSTAAVTVNHAGNRTGEIRWRPQDDDPPEKR
jgi:hypothetical protein